MKSKIEIIADTLIETLRDTLNLKEKEIKSESFKLIFNFNDYLFIFLCSLHHLDIPWKINFILKHRNKFADTTDIDSITTKNYDINPIFLANVDANAKVLTEKVKLDVTNLITDLDKSMLC